MGAYSIDKEIIFVENENICKNDLSIRLTTKASTVSSQVGQCFTPINECHQEAYDFTNWTKFMAEEISRAVAV